MGFRRTKISASSRGFEILLSQQPAPLSAEHLSVCTLGKVISHTRFLLSLLLK